MLVYDCKMTTASNHNQLQVSDDHDHDVDDHVDGGGDYDDNGDDDDDAGVRL